MKSKILAWLIGITGYVMVCIALFKSQEQLGMAGFGICSFFLAVFINWDEVSADIPVIGLIFRMIFCLAVPTMALAAFYPHKDVSAGSPEDLLIGVIVVAGTMAVGFLSQFTYKRELTVL